MKKSLFISFLFLASFSFKVQVFSQPRVVTVVGSTTWSTLFSKATTSSEDVFILTNEDQANTLTIDIEQVYCKSLTIGVKKEERDEGKLTILFNGKTINVATDLIFYPADEDENKRTLNIGTGSLLIGRNFFSAYGEYHNNSVIMSSGTLKVGGQWTIGHGISFTAGAGLVEFNGSAPQNLPNLSYANLSLSGAGIKIFPELSKDYPTSFNKIWTIQDLKIYAGTTLSLSYNKYIHTDANRVYKVAKLYLWEIDRLVGQDAGYYEGTGTRDPDPFVTAVQKDALGTSAGLILSTRAALPFTLSSFTARPIPDSKVSLGWVTSSEQLNKGFRVERQTESTNGKYEQIGFVGSKAKGGNSQNTLSYEFIDVAPKVGATSFYRLVQEDLDSKLTYTEVRVVKLNGQSLSMVFPNPSNSAVNIVRTADARKMNILVIDPSGKVISQFNNITDANYRIILPQSGVYNIKMIYTETGEQFIQRVVVQK